MLYEPVGYIIEYEISAIVFLFVIMLRYFGARRFPSQKNTIFSVILWVTVSDMILDVISSLIIDNVSHIPHFLTYTVNEVFYFLQILLPLLMTAYSFALTEHLKIRKFFPFTIPAAVIFIMLALNPLTHWFFSIDPVKGYIHEKFFILIYIACLFYIVVTFSVALRFRRRLRKVEFSAICRLLAIVLISMVVQYLYPALLISGVAIALSVILMYFTIQNPENMLDITTGAFTYEAMLTFLRDRVQEKDRIQLIAVKICNMRRINELIGIENGSRLLTQLCRFLKESGSDFWIFRMHGSCFVAATRNQSDYERLCELANQRLRQPWNVDGADVLMQATVCCIETDEFRNEPITPEQTVNILDNIILQNERSGKFLNRVTGGHDILKQIERSRTVEVALREALNTGEGLEIYLQPLWSIRDNCFSGAEVLLRFNHPVIGSIPPSEFVPIAESNGLITAMDEFVLRKTCEFINENNLERDFDIKDLEINLSALEFMQQRLPELLDEIVMKHNVDPSFIIFEITETAATESFNLLRECMHDLCGKGYRFALDDFGTGYANISQVIQLPFSMVKLDCSLLYGSEVVLEDMARMFKRMDLLTVVEGVENVIQADRMHRLSIDIIQGYHYAKPMSRADFLAFLGHNIKKSQ